MHGEYLLSPVAHIINIRLSTGIFPNIFKISNFIDDFKQIKNNFRPIAITNVMSKFLSKYVEVPSIKFFYKYNINWNQFGFQKNKATVDTLRCI